MTRALQRHKWKVELIRVTASINVKLNQLIGKTFHGTNVEKFGLNESQAKIERNQRIHRGNSQDFIIFHRDIEIGVTGRLFDNKYQRLFLLM